MAKTIVRRDKEKTKQKILNAVGKILRKEGYHAIKINKIAETAGVGKPLIYQYFNGLNGLIKAYLTKVDFWNHQREKFANSTLANTGSISKEIILSLLKEDFEYLERSEEMQKVILWGISEKNKTLKTLIEEREAFGKDIFELVDKDFAGTNVDFRAVNAILVAATYYMVLHAKTNGVNMCEIDVGSKEGKQRIFNTFEQILDRCYRERKSSK